MNDTTKLRANPALLVMVLAVGLLGGLAGAALFNQFFGGTADGKMVREYILANPEVLPDAMERLQQKEDSKRLASIKDQVAKPFPGAILGNPNGKITVVEFADFACTYCRQSVADVEELIKQNKELRVVIRELPILSPLSADAAKMGLAAAEQGKYPQFHKAMFAIGNPDTETIAAAAKAAGLDMARARKFVADPRLEDELTQNIEFARQLGFSGTPSWVIGDQLLAGAVGKDKLAEAIAASRG